MAIQKITIATRLRPSTYEEITKVAEEKEMSVSELIRVVVENYLKTR